MVKFSGASWKWYFFCKFSLILMVSDKIIHRAFRIHKTLQTTPIRDFLLMVIYQNYTLAFNVVATDNDTNERDPNIEVGFTNIMYVVYVHIWTALNMYFSDSAWHLGERGTCLENEEILIDDLSRLLPSFCRLSFERLAKHVFKMWKSVGL